SDLRHVCVGKIYCPTITYASHLRAGFDRLTAFFTFIESDSFRHVPGAHELSCIKSANDWDQRLKDSRSLSKRAITMRTKHSLAVGMIGIFAIVGLLGWTASAQAPPPASATLACNDDPPPDTTPIDAALLIKGLPCAENVNPVGPSDDAL